MKRILATGIFLLSLIFCSACGNVEQKAEIEYESGVFEIKNWSETVGTYKKDVIPDKDTAIRVATAIFEGMETNADIQQYVPQHVFYDTEDEVWIVSFWKDQDMNADVIWVGGDCSIAMQKEDGKVLRIWYGE